MHRRDLLVAGIGVLGVGGLSGCAGRQSPDGDDGTDTPSTSTETPSMPTETPVPFPEQCEPLPDIDGLPAPPSELTEDSVQTFVEDFERVYAVATNEEYGGVDSLSIQSVETVGERFVVRLSFEAAPATSTPDENGETATQLPTDAYTHRAVYRLTDERLLREVRSHIDDSLLSETCWTLATE